GGRSWRLPGRDRAAPRPRGRAQPVRRPAGSRAGPGPRAAAGRSWVPAPEEGIDGQSAVRLRPGPGVVVAVARLAVGPDAAERRAVAVVRRGVALPARPDAGDVDQLVRLVRITRVPDERPAAP